jgi:two-component system, cell cycle response regulator DivK
MTRKKILYVENDPSSLLFIKRLLENKYDFDSAQNDKDALLKLKENDYDLVLMDIMLGGKLDGVEIMKWSKDFKPDSKTLFLAITTQSYSSGNENFLSKGFDGYFSKPLDIDKLISSIDLLLENAK